MMIIWNIGKIPKQYFIAGVLGGSFYMTLSKNFIPVSTSGGQVSYTFVG